MKYLAIAFLSLIPFSVRADSIVTVTADLHYLSGSFQLNYNYDTTTRTLAQGPFSYSFMGIFAPFVFTGQVGSWGINFYDNLANPFPSTSNILQLFFRDHGEPFPQLGSYCTCDLELNNSPMNLVGLLPGSFVNVTDPPDPGDPSDPPSPTSSTPEPWTFGLLALGLVGTLGRLSLKCLFWHFPQ